MLSVTGVLGAPQYVCADCGRDATGRIPTLPCLCGSTYRLRADPADSYRVVTERALPWFDPFKDWTVKYLQLTWNVNQLRRLYAAGTDGPAAVLRAARMSFVSCVELGDWLVAGPEPHSVTPGEVTRLLAGSPLDVAAALASGGPATLSAVAFSRPARAWADYRRPGAKPVRYDALDLAERCLASWRAFLSARGVSLPSW
jgi:hypothetical protein